MSNIVNKYRDENFKNSLNHINFIHYVQSIDKTENKILYF